MDTLLQDLRYAARTLIKNPGFAALTVMCLTLGIGVTSTIFSAVIRWRSDRCRFATSDGLV